MKAALILLSIFTIQFVLGGENNPAGLLSSEFIYENAPTKSCHASTLVESKTGLIAAWFGGTREGASDVGIWLSRLKGEKWSAPVEVATGVQPDGSRMPCWNPVLFQPKEGALMLFYKIGPSPSKWWGMLRTSTDGGKSWSDARKLPDGILGPIKNKPVQLPGGEILCPTSSEDKGWRVHFEMSSDLGATWKKIVPAEGEGKPIDAIQPSILFLEDGSLLALGRTRSQKIFETRSTDGGKSWSALKLTELPNPNSGTDAVTLKSGRHLLIHNRTPKGRTPLNLALLTSNGESWFSGPILEDSPGEYSYPAIIQTRDGLVHVLYTFNRERIKHVIIDEQKIEIKAYFGGKKASF